MVQECWQKGMVLRDTDWLCYKLNSQGPCGPNQRIVYTKRCQPHICLQVILLLQCVPFDNLCFESLRQQHSQLSRQLCRPRRPSFLWNCGRSSPRCRSLWRILLPVRILSWLPRAGGQMLASLPAGTLLARRASGEKQRRQSFVQRGFLCFAPGPASRSWSP